MKKCSFIKKSLLFVLSFAFAISALFIHSVSIKAQTNTSSEYVNTVTDLKTTPLIGGVTLYEQKMSSLLNGDATKIFQEHFVQWVDLDSFDNTGMKLVTWTKQSADEWSASTTRNCAIDWEKNHPGWIVVAGINGDFFQNSGKVTWEPTNNFMADGDMYRADLVGGYRGVVGINPDNSVIIGDPTFSQTMQLYIYDEEGNVEKLPIDKYNPATPSETGITLYTKDSSNVANLTGYQVYVGKYTICRISNGKNKTVFVKGDIQYAREGKESEIPMQKRSVTLDDGTTKTEDVREFYLVSKNAELAQKLANGTSVKCQYDYTGNWENVENSVGFIYPMLENGTSLHQGSTDSFIYTDHPRTFIGFKADGTPVLMVVDGRGLQKRPVEQNNFGVSLFEGAEIMKLAGCVSAFNLDGGGSSTLIVRNEDGKFDVINRPSDNNVERSTGNAIFLVMPDPKIQYEKSTASTVTFAKKDPTLDVTNYSVKMNDREYVFDTDKNEMVISGLEENTSYNAEMKYDYQGEHFNIPIVVKTKVYDPGVDINPTSNGFNIGLRQTDENLITSKITLLVEDQPYVIENTDGTKTEFIIDDLFKGETYRISYTYEVTIKETGKTYTREVAKKEYQTLDYYQPVIQSFTGEIKRGKISVEFEVEDEDSLMSRMYLLDNGTEIALDVSDYKYTVEDDMKEHIYQLVVEYVTPDDRTRTIKSEQITVVHAHEWLDASCSSPKTCKLCGKTEGDALPHTESDWIVDADATCKVEGRRHKECTVCHTILQEESIPTKAHTWVDASCSAPKTCSVCGETEGEVLPHTEGEWIVDTDATCKVEGKQHKECTTCHEVLKEETIAKLTHIESDWIVDTDATCKVEGKKHIECTVCHETLKEENIAKINHTWVEATCTAPKTCSVCKTTEGTALTHVESEWIIDTDATCTSEGKKHTECTICHETLKEESISKKNHTWADATTEAPKTCTVCGITEGDKLPKKKGCKKSSVALILSGISLLCASIYLIRRKK